MELDSDNKPYIRLPPPYTSITLTAYRPADAPILISMLNHPAVYMNLAGPPFPYLQKHHDSKVEQLETDQRTAVEELREFVKQQGGQRRWVSTVPFTVIRETTGVGGGEESGGDDGEGEGGRATAIGDFVVRRSDFYDINDEGEREVTKARNDGLEPGNRDIVWEIGFHGRGIMTAVLDVLTKEWLVPYMNVHHISASYLEHNEASRRVFEKCGWRFVKFEPDRIELPEVMTGVKGKKVGMGVMKWERKTS